MHEIKPKVSLSLQLFKFLGIYFEKYEIKSLKYQKILNCWPIWMYFVHLIFLTPLIFITSFAIFTGYMEFKESFLSILSLVVHMTSGTVCVVFTFLHRNKIKNLWNLINQLDDCIVRFLKINIDYKRENRQQLITILATLALNIVLGLIIKSFKFTLSKDFEMISTMGLYYVMINQLNGHKYIYFVTIILNRLEIIIKNYNQIKDDGYKLKALMQVYSILWKLSEKVGKIFDFQMVLNIMSYYSNFMFFGRLLAIDLANDYFNAFHIIAMFAPHLFVGFYCYHGERFRIIVSFSQDV